MAKQTSTLFKQMVEQAKSKLPSSRSANICIGCFAPRNTLTVRPHTMQIFTKDQVQIDQDQSRVSVTCLYCGEWRHLSISSYSYDVLLADFPDFTTFMIMKDHKDKCDKEIGCSCYTSIVGIDSSFYNDKMIKYLESLRTQFIKNSGGT